MQLNHYTIGSGPLRAKVEAIMQQRREAERQMQLAERRYAEEQQRRKKEEERRALEEVLAKARATSSTIFKEMKITKIKRLTAKHFNITVDELVCHRRQKPYVVARQIAMYLSKKHTLLSFPQIAAALDRDHSTVMYGIERVERAIAENDLDFVEPIAAITRIMQP